ncbi:MAG: DNA-3-methyladenine glycosylase [Patescibacteria group bacterium]
MNKRRISQTFFNKTTLSIAHSLLGCYLVRKVGRKVQRAKIIETEAYVGLKDKASHASRGLTRRTEVMFGLPARAYVYLIYGMYYCFNIVTAKQGYPAAVLIRGVILNNKLINGPGKVCRELKINKKINNENLLLSKKIYLERGNKVPGVKIKSAPRIGVDYAGKWKYKKWRFFVK